MAVLDSLSFDTHSMWSMLDLSAANGHWVLTVPVRSFASFNVASAVRAPGGAGVIGGLLSFVVINGINAMLDQLLEAIGYVPKLIHRASSVRDARLYLLWWAVAEPLLCFDGPRHYVLPLDTHIRPLLGL